jgi:hypothetical protein
MNRRRATLWALFGAASLTAASTAQAQDQPWLRDRRFTFGPGVKGDRLEYNAGVGATFGYNSNLFLRSGTAEEPRADSFLLSITPFVRVMSRAPSDGTKPSYSFTGQAALSYYEFFAGPTKNDTDNVSGHRNFGALAGLGLTIAPGQRWSGELHGTLARSIQPSNLGDPTASYNRTIPSAGTSISWTPGGGLFVWRVIGYDFTYNYFEASRFERFNNLNHTISTSSSWRFLPRTSLFNESKLSLMRYTSSDTEQPNGDAVSTRFGANGLVTNGFGFLVAGGWASTFFDSKAGAGKQDFDTFIAQAEARFYLTAPPHKEDEPGVYPSTFVLGYLRDWQQSYIGNFYGRDRGYGTLSYFFNGRVLASLTGGVARLNFPATAFASIGSCPTSART